MRFLSKKRILSTSKKESKRRVEWKRMKEKRAGKI